MKKTLLSLIAVLLAFNSTLPGIELLGKDDSKKVVTATKRIYLPSCPGAYNPSIVKFQDGYLMTFRWSPSRIYQPWLSYIGIVLLDESFDPISTTELLNTRIFNPTTPSQSEDARIIWFNEKLFLVYNDNMELIFPSAWERRDMYITELIHHDGQFLVAEPLRLIHETKYRERPWQKNWAPFEWDGKLMLSYMINPHEVIVPDLKTGLCKHQCESHKNIKWDYDSPRGGTPAQLVDGEYLAFFHSGNITRSASSENEELWHYYMGAYTFSAEPPFALTKFSSAPIDSPGFYTYSSYSKRIIYPGGFVVDGQNVYLSYGKDDSEIWVATIDLIELKNSMIKID